jgi:tRNA threonylcarbamoyladenosine biosynthesis protein TsaB
LPPDPRPGFDAGRVLALDTSGPWVALALGGQVRTASMATGQSEALFPMAEALLRDVGLGWNDLSGVAVGTGPGNFTGVRIAVAAARGLALGLGVPAAGVTLPEAMAHGRPRPCRIRLDARRGEVLVQDFSETGLTGPMTLVPAGPEVLEPDPLAVIKAIGDLGAARIAAGQRLRPAPSYVRAADALPPSDPPPALLDA